MESNKPVIEDRRKEFAVPEGSTPIKTGLRRKFIITISALIGIFSLAFFTFYFQSTKVILSDFHHNHCVEKCIHLAGIITGNIPDLNKEQLEIITREIMEREKLAYIVVLDKVGETISEQTLDGIVIEPLTIPELEKNKVHTAIKKFETIGKIKEIITPLIINDYLKKDDQEQIGYIQIGIKTDKLIKRLMNHSLYLVLGIGFFILVGIILALFLYRIIISPIQQLARAMKVVADDDIEFDEEGLPSGRRFRRYNDLNLDIQSNDEIEQLSDEFMAMVKKLEKSYTKLEEMVKEMSAIAKEKSQLAEELETLNRQHEGVIKERTREIVEKNLRLYEISEELQFQKDELIGTNEDLEKISRMKSEFLANMSHELRTPLNAIIGFAEVLKDKMFGDVNERQEKYLHNIVTSGRHLLSLINGILDISKVEAGKMTLSVEPYAVNKVIEEVQNIIKTLAYKKNIDIKLDLSRDLMVEGDPARFKQILYNLLSNAIKFTDEKGEVIITTKEVPADTTFDGGAGTQSFTTMTNSFMLTVRDNGIGIKGDDQERIFNEFEQLDQTACRQYEGTGLGLPLTKRLVYLHGGHIWLESTLGEGTMVYVVLPIKTKQVEIDPQEETP